MNGLPYYRAYPRDFFEGTAGLPFEVKAGYRLVLDMIYMQGGSLPDDPRYISGLLGCSVRKWTSLKNQLIAAGKISVRGQFLTNNRVEKELRGVRRQADNSRQSTLKLGDNSAEPTPNRRDNSAEPTPNRRDNSAEKEPELKENRTLAGASRVCARAHVCALPEPDTDTDTDKNTLPPPPPVGGGDLTLRERVLSAMGLGPDGIVGPSRFLGSRGDVAEAERWLGFPGLTLEAIEDEIRRVMAGKPDGPPSSFRYFTAAMERLSGALTAPALRPDYGSVPSGGTAHAGHGIRAEIPEGYRQ